MRKTALFLAATALTVAPAGANEMTFQLQATVPVMCSVTDIQAIDLENGQIEVGTMCNADSFRLVLGGDLTELPLRGAGASGASVSVMQDAIAVRPARPGVFRFRLDYGQDLTQIQSISASLDMY